MDEFVCKVCGKGVSKRKSYQYQDGRACKEHMEAQTANVHKQEEIERKKEAEKKANEEALKRKAERYSWDFEKAKLRAEEDAKWMRNHCWRCGVEGVTFQVYCLRMLIGMKKRDLLNDNNFLNFEAQVVAARLKGVTFIAFFENVSRGNRVYRYLMGRTRFMADFTASMLLCPDCAKLNGLNFKDAFAPKVNFNVDDLQKAIDLYESSILKVAVEAVAKAEVAEEMARN